MTTLYIRKARLDELVREHDDREKEWWFASVSSNDEPPEAYVAGHEWAAAEATWHDLKESFVAFAAARARQPLSPINEKLAPFYMPAARRGLINAATPFAELSEDEWLSLRLFIEGALAVALLVLKHSTWSVAEISR